MNANTPDIDPVNDPDMAPAIDSTNAPATDTDPGGAGARDSNSGRPPRPPSYRGALVIGAAATLLMVTLLVVALTDPYRGAHRHEEAPGVDRSAPLVGHIHGIAPDEKARGQARGQAGKQGDGRVLIGAHYGLFSVDTDGSVNRVGDSAADYMALTAAEPGRLLASGHPELTDTDLPVNLGLMESRDGGVTWQALSLDGAADFHSLEHTSQRTWGIDSATGGLLTSTDERIWQTVHTKPLVDLAADPEDPDRVVATTTNGHLVEIDANTERETETDGAPELAYIDWPTPSLLVGIGADGVVWRSEDGGHDWGELARVSGQPTAISVVGNRWFVATSDGLFRGPVASSAPNEDVKQVLTFTS